MERGTKKRSEPDEHDGVVESDARPYPHWILRPFDESFLRSVRAELLGLGTAFKETDLFRLNQTVDFGNLGPQGFPAIAELKKQLYSAEFRARVERVTNCGTLNSRVDCAGNVYGQGCHLGCHDDCISSRRISYILYLSDEGWTQDDGGALELYAPDDFVPQKTVLPFFGSMMTFRVAAGVSLHSVQEVFSSTRRRISIQGWFHTDEEIVQRENATISVLTSSSCVPRDLTSSTSEDVKLSDWINPVYLKSIAALKHSLQSGSVLLNQVLLPQVFSEIASVTNACDEMDQFGGWHRPEYTDGLADGWTLVGPPHVRRFCLLGEVALPAKTKLARAGLLLSRVRALLCSASFREWVGELVGEKLSVVAEAQVRRFRPGLDYLVAHGQTKSARSILYATFCTAHESAEWSSGNVGGHHIFMSGEEDAETARKEAEVYVANNEDDVLSICPASNALSLVWVKENSNKVQFVQYVNAGAPG